MRTRENLAVSLVLAISMVGVSYGEGGVLPGDGLSESTAYLIEDLADFDVFADQANAATYWPSGVYTKLACDPNLAGRPYTTAVIAPDTSTDYGYQGTSFTGVFDGDGHVVSNLTIDTAGAGNDHLGLFGEIEGAVKNLGMENVIITGGTGSDFLGGLCGKNDYGTITNCYANSSVTGGESLGGLYGHSSYGTINNCYATGSITGASLLGGLCGNSWRGTIINCYATGAVTGDSSLGGLCGNNSDGTITNCYATGAVNGDNICGGLCGSNSGSISDCNATGLVTGGSTLGGLCGHNTSGTITNCYAAGAVTGDGSLGGLCGYNHSTITNCYATGAVTGTDNSDYLGGLCGKQYRGTITNCYAAGAVTGGDESERLGGLCGFNESSTIANCYAAGPVIGGDNSQYLGGLCGYNNSSDTITNCFWDTDTSGLTDGVGNQDPAGVVGETTANMQIQTTFTDAGWDFVGESANGTDDIWEICEGTNYPRLSWQFLPGDFAYPEGVNLIDFAVLADTWGLSSGQVGYNGLCDLVDDDMIDMNDLAVFAENWLCCCNSGDGSAANPFQIKTPAHLHQISNLSGYWRKHFVLTADIDMAAYSYTTAVIAPDTNIVLNGHQGTAFSGAFDGAGFVISNLTIDAADTENDYLGLFGRIDGSSAEIKNLGIENINVTSGDNSWRLGGLCGEIDYGAITNCYTSGSVTGGDGSYDLGGLCGDNLRGIISDCYFTGSVTGSDNLGGLCGSQYQGTISNCYAASSVAGGDSSEYLGGLCGSNGDSTITNCYAAGTVTGGEYPGGLCGFNDSTITNCFWDVETSGMTDGVGNQDPDPAGVIGKTTAEMQTRSTFTDVGWDFVGESANGTEDIWDISEGTNYPNLYW